MVFVLSVVGVGEVFVARSGVVRLRARFLGRRSRVGIVLHCPVGVERVSFLAGERFGNSTSVGSVLDLSARLLLVGRTVEWMASECYLLTFDLGKGMPGFEGCSRFLPA